MPNFVFPAQSDNRQLPPPSTQTATPAATSTDATSSPQSGSGVAGETAAQETNQPPSAPERMAPISGAQMLTPGTGSAARSYLLPSFEYTGYADTNPTGFRKYSQPRTQSTYTGSLTLQRVQNHSQFNLEYAGGGFWYSQQLPVGNQQSLKPYGTFHSLALFEQVSTRRWKWMIGNQGMYLPQSPFGFSGFGGLSSFGGGFGGGALSNSPAVGASFNADQSIVTGLSRRFADTAVTEIEYDISARSAVTATASYGTLQFLDPGFIDSRYYTFMVGYNHALSPRDEVAITYAHLYFKFNGPNRELLNRGFAILYGHKISGRFSFQLSVSPLVHQIAKPLGGSITQTFFSGFGSLQFRGARWNGALSFARMPSGGSGILPGAETDLAQGTIGRQLTRRIRGSIMIAHAYNQSATQQTKLAFRSKYEYWSAGASLSREFGPHLSTYLSYTAERQVSNTPLCVGGSCTTAFIRQVGGLGINLHPRAIKID